MGKFHFVRSQSWLHDFALFVVIQRYFNGMSWWEWPDEGLRYHRVEALNVPKNILELNYIYFVNGYFPSVARS